MLTRRSRTALGFATAALALFAIWLLWHWADPAFPEGVNNVLAIPFSMFTTGCAVAAAIRCTVPGAPAG